MQTLTASQRSLLESQTAQYETHLVAVAGYLEARGISEETAVTARLGMVDEPLPFDSHAAGNYLSIPYLTRAGVVSLRYRCLREHECDGAWKGHGKYITRAGDHSRIYGVEDLVDAGASICVTEGELDRLVVRQMGYPAVAFPGANTWKAHYRRLFEDFNRIVVLADGDDAGTTFAGQWLKLFPRSAEVVRMDDKEDVTSMYMLYGEDYFHDRLQ